MYELHLIDKFSSSTANDVWIIFSLCLSPQFIVVFIMTLFAPCGLQELWFFLVRIGRIRFLAGCCKRRLNQG